MKRSDRPCHHAPNLCEHIIRYTQTQARKHEQTTVQDPEFPTMEQKGSLVLVLQTTLPNKLA